MRMNWFRVYNEARNDAKLRTLSDGQFRVWFNLLCLSSEQSERGTIENYDFDLLSIEVAGGDDDVLRSSLKQLQRLRIITDDGSTISFLHFLERQYDKPSDQPAAVRGRVTRHRETSNKEDETPSNAMKRDETHIQEERREEERGREGEEEREGEPRKSAAARAPLKNSLPPTSFPISDERYLKAKQLGWKGTRQQLERERDKFLDYYTAQGKKQSSWEASWHNWVRKAVDYGDDQERINGNGSAQGQNGAGRRGVETDETIRSRKPFRTGLMEALERTTPKTENH